MFRKTSSTTYKDMVYNKASMVQQHMGLEHKHMDTPCRVPCPFLGPYLFRVLYRAQIRHRGRPVWVSRSLRHNLVLCHKQGKRKILSHHQSLGPYHVVQYHQIPAFLSPPHKELPKQLTRNDTFYRTFMNELRFWMGNHL